MDQRRTRKLENALKRMKTKTQQSKTIRDIIKAALRGKSTTVNVYLKKDLKSITSPST